MMQALLVDPALVPVLAAIAVVLLFATVGLLFVVLARVRRADPSSLAPALATLSTLQERSERTTREELAAMRRESGESAQRSREEQATSLKGLAEDLLARLALVNQAQVEQMEQFSGQIRLMLASNEDHFTRLAANSRLAQGQMVESVEREFGVGRETAVTNANAVRDFLGQALGSFSEHVRASTEASREGLVSLRDGVEARIAGFFTQFQASGEALRVSLGEAQRQLRETLLQQVAKLAEGTERQLETVRLAVDGQLRAIQQDNAAQLERMRATVEEKLQGTLERRLGESFRLVSDRLEQVHRGLGEMQQLASDVGSLQRVLTNVKTRGGWGEVQLGALLEQVLQPGQFEKNVRVRPESNEYVEYAIKLPGPDAGSEKPVWLPIDAKFPVEDFQRLLDAQERAATDEIERAAKDLEASARLCASELSKKYLQPPHTTDFGIMFLPTEGLYAEIVRRNGFVERLQRDFRVVVAGPTTLAALLNSLQMGFRTLAIQQRSSEVWNILAGVKTEFGRFGEAIEAVQKKLQEAANKVDDVRLRSRVLTRKLNDVQSAPELPPPPVDPIEQLAFPMAETEPATEKTPA